MMQISALFNNFIKCDKSNNSENVYDILKPYFIEQFNKQFPVKSTGRPRITDLGKIFDAIFAVAEEGIKTRNIKKYFDVPKSTYNRFLKLIKETDFFGNIHKSIVIDRLNNDKAVITDTFTVKSCDGSDCVGSNSTDKGRNGIKSSLITSFEDGVPLEYSVHPANEHDSKILQKMEFTNEHHGKIKKIYADSAYIGKPLKTHCKQHNICVISVPRRTRSGKLTHYVQTYEKENLKKRWRIERTIGCLRQFRGISIKRMKFINTYTCLLSFAVLCVTCLALFS